MSFSGRALFFGGKRKPNAPPLNKDRPKYTRCPRDWKHPDPLLGMYRKLQASNSVSPCADVQMCHIDADRVVLRLRTWQIAQFTSNAFNYRPEMGVLVLGESVSCFPATPSGEKQVWARIYILLKTTLSISSTGHGKDTHLCWLNKENLPNKTGVPKQLSGQWKKRGLVCFRTNLKPYLVTLCGTPLRIDIHCAPADRWFIPHSQTLIHSWCRILSIQKSIPQAERT